MTKNINFSAQDTQHAGTTTHDKEAQARLACGEAGLKMLHKCPYLGRELAEFYRTQIEEWLQRELASYEPAVTLGSPLAHKSTEETTVPARFQLKFSRTPFCRTLQLRHDPETCMWLLLVRRGHGLMPHVPFKDKKCLSLADWLGQVRQLVTRGDQR